MLKKNAGILFAILVGLGTPVFAVDLSGAWTSFGRTSGVLHQRDDRVTIIDEDAHRGYGAINGNNLTITNYERPGAASRLTAKISNNGMALEWPGNTWTRKGDTYQIWLLDFICHSQNESGLLKGDDEMYIVRTVGKTASIVGEWHDFDKGKRVKDILLWEGKLTKGQSVDMTFVVMEEDDDKDVAVKAIGDALKKIEGEDDLAAIVRAIGVGLSTLAGLAQDPDDHIGTFTCRISRDANDRLHGTWAAKDLCEVTKNPSAEDPQASTLEVHGDDARYELWLYPFDPK